MLKTLHFKSLFLLLCLIIGGSSSAWGEEVTYKLTIDNSSFNTTSYTANNNEKTSQAICTTDNTKTYEVKWTTNQIMKGTGGNADYMQWQKNAGYLYNSTNLGTITNVTITKTSGTFTTYYGTSAQPSSNTTVGEGFFQIKVGNATGYTTRIEVTFKIDEAPAASLTSISVKTPPTKTAYKVGEALDLSGLELLATYDNNETTGVTTGYTTSPTNGANLSAENTKVTITYKEKTTVQAITVGTLSSISSNADFANTTYTEKEYFNPEGLVITAHYSNGIEEVVNDYTLNPSATTALETTNDKVTVSYTWANETKTVEIPITVNAGTKYTVTFDAQTGTCGTASLTEEVYQGGVTLPSATCSMAGWVFAGWAEAAVKNTTTKPILYAAGETYYPTEAKTLYAVYTLEVIGGYEYVRATSLNDITSAPSVVIITQNMVLDNALGDISAPTDENGEILATDATIWQLNGNNTEGYTLTNNSLNTNIKTLGIQTIPSNYANISINANNNKWLFVESTNASHQNEFVIRNTNLNNNSKVGSIQYYSDNWKMYCLAATSFASNENIALKVYIPKTAYNSNPAGAIINPVVEFEKEGTTLYLDGTTTYTNAATVKGIDKTATYTSSDESVATVASDGTVTAVGIGTATITASVAQKLGVNNAASATYEIVVKSTTTIAGIKNITDASAAVNFTADLTDAVVTYVKDGHAYIQDATAAIYASCGSDLTVGQKINGAVSGSVKAANKIDEITSIDLDKATVTNDGAIPEAEVKTLAGIKAAGTEYDGKLVTVNGATVTGSLSDSQSSNNCSIKDGSKEEDIDVSFNLYAPNTGITVNASEIGNFTGFVSIFNGSYRLNLYEQSQIFLTQNAAREQELSFDEDAIVLDEETTEFDKFIGQAVNGAQGTVTYAITGDAIGAVDNDGIVELNGTCGTATVTATAAAITKEVDGIPTPYKAATKSYTITVRPRYSVVFAVNGVEETLREASFGEGVTVPSPAQLGDYYFVGWSTAVVETTDEVPSMPAIGATVYPEDNNGKYYAVYATKTVGEDQEIKYTNSGARGTDTTTGITAAGNINTTSSNGNPGNSFGLTSSSNNTITLTNIDASEATSAYIKFDYRLAKSGTSFSSLTVSQFNRNNQTLGTATQITGSDQTYHTTSEIAINTNCTKITIVCNPASSQYNTFVDNIIISITKPSIAYAGYTTSIPTPSITLGGIAGATETDYKFATFSADQAVVFTDDVTVYAVSVDENNNLVKTELTKDDYFVVGANSDGIVSGGYYVPANTGVMLRSTGTSSNYYFAATDESVTIPTNMMIAGTGSVPSETDYKYYKLTYEDANHQHIGFYWGAAEGAPFMTKKGKAYLRLPKTVNARGFSLFDDDDTTTGIEMISSVMNDGEVYNLNGQRVDNLKKGGLYIVNGKKVVIK